MLSRNSILQPDCIEEASSNPADVLSCCATCWIQMRFNFRAKICRRLVLQSRIGFVYWLLLCFDRILIALIRIVDCSISDVVNFVLFVRAVFVDLNWAEVIEVGGCVIGVVIDEFDVGLDLETGF